MKKHIALTALMVVISADCFARGGSAPYHSGPLTFMEKVFLITVAIPLIAVFYWQVFVVGTYESIKNGLKNPLYKDQPKPATQQIKPHTPQPKTNHIDTSVPRNQPFQKTQQIKAIREVVRPSTYQPKELTGFKPQN